MTTVVALVQEPILQFFLNNGDPNVGGSLLTQVGGVDFTTYSESTGTIQFPNPIPLNSRGEISTQAGASSPLFVVPNVAYTYTLFDANGVQIWSAPNIISPSTVNAVLAGLTQASLIPILNLWPPTDAERAVSVTPVYSWYAPYTAQRYGIDITGTTDSTAAMNLAHSIGVVITYPPGSVLFGASGSVTIPAGGIKGASRMQTILSSQDTSANNTILCTGTAAYLFEDFEMGLAVVKTAGAVIAIVGDGAGIGGNLNIYTDFNRCNFLGFPACISFVQAAFWSVARCFFYECVGIAISVQDTTNIDGGDGIVGPGNVFTANNSTGFGVYWLTGGGLRVCGNKFLSGNTAVAISPTAATGTTADFYIHDNSIENQSTGGVTIIKNSGAVALGNVQVYNNEIAIAGGSSITVAAVSGTFVQQLSIYSNTINLSATSTAILLGNASNILIEGNLINGSSGACNGITIQSSCTGGRVGINSFSGTFGYKVSNSSTTVQSLYPTQVGVATSGAVSTAMGFAFTTTGSVTFPLPYSATDAAPIITATVTAGTGAISVIVTSTSNTGFAYTVVGAITGHAITFVWTAYGDY